ncbi:aspartyl protease family protein [Rhodoblastus sphagnicola]|nr:TIGR02281 family clan AA aspartic protease [Rhodoblastus sphagnicola]MBB4197429.1 aspartyl protease family protein [Rhodoblastus sphagnicola]
MKMAVALVVISLLAVSALKDHWFARFFPVAPPPPVSAANVVSAEKPAPTRSGWGRVELAPDAAAQYRARVEINGARIDALVDTGASHVLLTAEDARLLNIDPPASAYTVRSQTANGEGRVAPARLREIRVGGVVVYDVEAAVAQPGKASITLLGMSFLKKLTSFQVADGLFVMKQ